jgi:hypothetical protein
MHSLITESLHDLIYHNIYCSDPRSPKWGPIAANGFERRALGFRAEAEFKTILSENNINTLDGGWLLPNVPKVSCLQNPIYFTVSNDSTERYTELYKTLLKLRPLKMFFIRFEWEKDITKSAIIKITDNGISIPVPSFECCLFEQGKFVNVTDGVLGLGNFLKYYGRKENVYTSTYSLSHQRGEFLKNYIGNLSDEIGKDILANRLIIDGLLGMNAVKGMPADIDCIIPVENKFIFNEVKEKDKSKTPPVGFGMDIHRIDEIQKIGESTGCEFYYIVKEVNNQSERKHLGWRSINMKDFIRLIKGTAIKEGGSGMATARGSDHPTLVAPYEKFRELTDFSTVQNIYN